MRSTRNPHDVPPTRAKVIAERHGASMARLIEEGQQPRLQAAPCALAVFRGNGGLTAGLTGCGNKAMLDAAGG